MSDQQTRTGYKPRVRRPARGNGSAAPSTSNAAATTRLDDEEMMEAVTEEASLTEPPSTIPALTPIAAEEDKKRFPPPRHAAVTERDDLVVANDEVGSAAGAFGENDAIASATEEEAMRAAPGLDRGLSLPTVIIEPVLWTLALVAALITRLASLTSTPLSVPEAQRAFAAWQWATGMPVAVDGKLWGPFAFLQTGLAFFLFGAGDTIGRIGPALAGVALVAACFWLRPFIGRWGAWGTAVLIALSPTFVYGSRQITGLPWVALAAFALFICILRAERARPATGTVLLAAGALVVLLGSGAEGLTMLLALALATAIIVAFAPRAGESANEKTVEDASAAPVAPRAPVQRFLANVATLDRRVLSAALVLFVVLAVAVFSLLFTDLVDTPRTIGGVLGDWWGSLLTAKRNEPWFYYLMIAFVYEPFIGVGAIIALIVIARMAAPRPLAVSLTVVWQAMAVLLFSLSGGKSPEAAMMILLPLAMIGGVAFEWLATQFSGGWFWRDRAWGVGVGVFFTFVAAAQFLRAIKTADRSVGWVATIFALIVLLCVVGYITATMAASQPPTDTRTVLVATLLFLSGIIGVRAMSGVTFANPDDPHELLVGTRTAVSMTPLVDRIRRISVDLTRDPQFRTFDPQKGDRTNITGGNALAVSADPSVQWPLQWYLRDFPNFVVQAAADAPKNRPAGPDGAPLPQIVVVQTDTATIAGPALQTQGYQSQNYAYTVAYPARYRAQGTGGVLLDLLNLRTWGDRIGYFFSRTTTQPPITTNLTVYYSQEVASRIFYVGGGSPGAASAPASSQVFNLFDRGGKGKAQGQFTNPRGIVVGPDGTITIVDQLNYRVQQFDANGGFLRQFGSVGTGPGNFGQLKGYPFGPTGVAVAPDGTLFVTDTWNHRVSVFSPTGQPLRQWGTFFNGQDDPAGLPMHPGDFYGPRGVAIGPDGLVYVTDGGNGRVSVFKQDGTWVRTIGSRGMGPGQMLDCIGIAVKADGTIAVADPDNGHVNLFAPDGTFRGAIPVPEWGTTRGQEPYPVWLPNGNLLVPVPIANRLYEMTPTGQIARTITGTTGDLRKPVSVALLPDSSTALVVNDETNTVVRLTLNG